MNRVSLIAVLGMASLCARQLDAHKPVTSKYTFSEDVYPIFNAQCGGCHTPGGAAPMSLLTYEEARPWAESIRLELTTGHMPPWYGDPGIAPLRDVHKLSPRDLDVVLTWATGGTPPGPPLKAPVPVAKPRWPKGRPDVTFAMPAVETVPADKAEETREIVLQDDNDRERSIAFADVLPGNPSVVHDATVFSRHAGDTEPATVFAVWLPGSVPVAPASGYAFRWHVHEQLVARIHYKKNWKSENKPASDRSTVGLYLTKAAEHDIRGFSIGSSREIASDLRAIAVRVAGAHAELPIRVEAIAPDGARFTLAGFLARPGWDERYWLARPVDLPKGTRIEINQAARTRAQIWVDASPM